MKPIEAAILIIFNKLPVNIENPIKFPNSVVNCADFFSKSTIFNRKIDKNKNKVKKNNRELVILFLMPHSLEMPALHGFQFSTIKIAVTLIFI